MEYLISHELIVSFPDIFMENETRQMEGHESCQSSEQKFIKMQFPQWFLASSFEFLFCKRQL